MVAITDGQEGSERRARADSPVPRYSIPPPSAAIRQYAANDYSRTHGQQHFRRNGELRCHNGRRALGVDDVAAAIRARVGDNPLYLSIDIDVLDPAHAPGTGTPEAGGLTSRELLGILRGLAGLRLVGADVVVVAPAYDHAEVTAVAAAHVCYELLALMALSGG